MDRHLGRADSISSCAKFEGNQTNPMQDSKNKRTVLNCAQRPADDIPERLQIPRAQFQKEIPGAKFQIKQADYHISALHVVYTCRTWN